MEVFHSIHPQTRRRMDRRRCGIFWERLPDIVPCTSIVSWRDRDELIKDNSNRSFTVCSTSPMQISERDNIVGVIMEVTNFSTTLADVRCIRLCFWNKSNDTFAEFCRMDSDMQLADLRDF